ncbi:hypothetical protein XENOCAPTIV_029029, partial [Xenoophorus captivus]
LFRPPSLARLSHFSFSSFACDQHCLCCFAPVRYDYVEVRDGVDENGQLVGKYCGKIAPSAVVSSGNQLFIKFVSDYETHGAGFSIRYEIFKTGRLQIYISTNINSLRCLKGVL